MYCKKKIKQQATFVWIITYHWVEFDIFMVLENYIKNDEGQEREGEDVIKWSKINYQAHPIF